MTEIHTRLSNDNYRLMDQMDYAFEARNRVFFERILSEKPLLALSIRAICILGEIGNEDSVVVLSKLLLEDENPLVRHEAAFSLGQLGYRSAVPTLIKAMLTDSNVLVRHEAAGALGSIGDNSAMTALFEAENDENPEVRESASNAIVNLEFLAKKNFFQRLILVEE